MTTQRRVLVAMAVLSAVGALPVLVSPAPSAAAADAGDGQTFRASIGTDGTQAEAVKGISTRARISQDGRYVCYQTKAKLDPKDNDGWNDIYWTDLSDPFHPVTRRVSDGYNPANPQGGGATPNEEAEFCEINQNGRYVVFSTKASNTLPAGSPSGAYIRDMFEPDRTKAIKVIDPGSTRPVISADARIVSYNTLPASTSDIYVKDLVTGNELKVNPETGQCGTGTADDGESFRPELSSDGNFVVFASDLCLSPNDTNNGGRDTYLADLRPWRANQVQQPVPLKLVSIGLNGKAVGGASSRPGINGDGRVVSWQSYAGGFTAGDTNGTFDAFVRDYRACPAGAPETCGVTTLISYKADGSLPVTDSTRPQLDDSGNVVVFVSTAGQIVAGDDNGKEDAFLRHWYDDKVNGRKASNTYLLGISPTGDAGSCTPALPGDKEGTKAISTRPYVDASGQNVVFVSAQCDLVTQAAFGGPDTNRVADIFVRRYGDPRTPPIGGGPPGAYVPLSAPFRLLDTRPSGKVGAGGVYQLLVAGQGGISPSAATVALNVTVVDPSEPGFLTVYPCPATGGPPNASNVNYGAGQTVPNAVITKVGVGGKVCFFTSAATHLIVDAGGAFPATPDSYQPLGAPARLLDTRPTGLTVDHQFEKGGLRPGGSLLAVKIAGRAGLPGSAASAALNVTVTGPTAGGYVTVWPCDTPQPVASSLNFAPGQTVANAVVTNIAADQTVCFFTSAPTHLIIDAGGHFPNEVVYVPLPAPKRFVDTRPNATTFDGLFLAAGKRQGIYAVDVRNRPGSGIPANGVSAVLNVTVDQPSAGGFVTVFPCDAPQPNASNLNFAPGQTVPNAVITRMSATGQVCFFASAPTHLIVDVAGWLP